MFIYQISVIEGTSKAGGNRALLRSVRRCPLSTSILANNVHTGSYACRRTDLFNNGCQQRLCDASLNRHLAKLVLKAMIFILNKLRRKLSVLFELFV